MQEGTVPARVRTATRALPDINANECALLVLGCQNGILDALPDSDALLMKINAAEDIVRIHGGHVYLVRIALDDLDYQFMPTTNKEFSMLSRDRRFQNDTSETAVHPALTVQPNDVAVRARRLGAFSTTDLDERLTNLGVTTLILCGAHTSGALLSTVREAADRDYRLIVLQDSCADPDTEIHRLLMGRIFPRQAEIISADALYRSFASDKLHRKRNSTRTPQTL
ncbi:cysteine hydrolase [Mycolicibacterium palauense]|uniref:cysteine hydrolase n=1 Tax=Mycolicibacterium palauense TaxID=2034511 RepID=UPI00159B91F1|nr:cysteine hydrolase [Mycolicibacterium palauense]